MSSEFDQLQEQLFPAVNILRHAFGSGGPEPLGE